MKSLLPSLQGSCGKVKLPSETQGRHTRLSVHLRKFLSFNKAALAFETEHD